MRKSDGSYAKDIRRPYILNGVQLNAQQLQTTEVYAVTLL